MQIYPHPAEFASGNSETAKCPQTSATQCLARRRETLVEKESLSVAYAAGEAERTVSVLIEAAAPVNRQEPAES